MKIVRRYGPFEYICDPLMERVEKIHGPDCTIEFGNYVERNNRLVTELNIVDKEGRRFVYDVPDTVQILNIDPEKILDHIFLTEVQKP